MINTLEELMSVCGYSSEASIDWEAVSRNMEISEDFIREHKDWLNWIIMSYRRNLSESFIREYKDLLSWWVISHTQKLSEDFIREFKDLVNWSWISLRQELSEDFIREFKDLVDLGAISFAQKLSDAFIEEFKDYYIETQWGRVLASEFNCGSKNKPIVIYSKEPTRIRINSFEATHCETIMCIMKRYGTTLEALEYIAKVNKCFDSLK